MKSIQIQTLQHIAIIGTNKAKSLFFYQKALGFELIRETHRKHNNSTKIDLRKNHICELELFIYPDAPKRISFPEACGLRHIAFEVEDLRQTIQHFAQFKIIAEELRTDPIDGKLFTFIFDPDNLPIEFCQTP